MDEKASIRITLHGLGGGVDHLDINFDELPEGLITPELRRGLLHALELITAAVLAASKVAA